MEEAWRELLAEVQHLLKPLGWRKEGGNFRLFLPDSLGWIIQFQRDRTNTAEEIGFTVNAGVYLEKDVPMTNRRFREVDCQVRARPACLSPRYGRDTWWRLAAGTDLAALREEMKAFLLRDVLPFLDRFPTRERTVELILNGQAEAWTDRNVLHLDTARLLADMGDGGQVLMLIEPTRNERFQALAVEIREKEKLESDSDH